MLYFYRERKIGEKILHENKSETLETEFLTYVST